DHLAFEGAAIGMAANPEHAGDGTTLLPGVECRDYSGPLVVLGVTASDVEALRARQKNSGARLPYGARHAVIQTIPSALPGLAGRGHTWVGDLVGLELSDGTPSGLGQRRREHAALLALAASRALAVVAGSNNHGWAHTPAAWSVLRIPAWRTLPPDVLDQQIQDLLRRNEVGAVRVIERHAADSSSTTWGLAATLPIVGWDMLATLSVPERASWLAWTWGLALVLRRRGRRR